MTRIVSGRWGGRRLAVPRSGVRPTSDRVREAVFNWLDHRVDWVDARILDIYAGSGALGLEALSRGAGQLVVVERDRGALGAIRRNVSGLGAEADVDIRAGAARSVAGRDPTTCDVVFADPPYDVAATELGDVLGLFGTNGWFAPEAVLIVETAARTAAPWPDQVHALERREYGDSAVWYGRWQQSAPREEED